MNAIELLEGQHREVEKEFEAFEKAAKKGDIEAKLERFHRIAHALAVHTTLEEKVFYPSVYLGELEGDLKEAVEEHLSAKRIISDLLDLEASDENFDAKVKVLKEQIEHHVEEEEEELFKDVKKAFTKDELEMIGQQMEAMAEDLEKGDDPMDRIPSETDHAAPLQ